MKNLILIFATVSLLSGCKNQDKKIETQSIRQATLDSVEYANKQQRMIDSLEALTRSTPTLITESPAMVPLTEAPRKTKHIAHAGTIHNTPQTNGTAPVAVNPASTPSNGTVATTPEKKKGLNNAAKGAIIGLGTGAAAGAIIGKENRGKGAIIGGVIGAIGGAVGGAVIDKSKAKKAARRDSLRRDSIRNSN